jgi:TonB-linked SusC/RagA family outer membrane protein
MNKFHVKLLFIGVLIFVFCLSGLLFAQTKTTFKGLVADEDGNPLPGANVFIEDLRFGASTDIEGCDSFEIPKQFSTGEVYTLTARFVGYKIKAAEVVLSGEEVTQNFTLAEDILSLEEIVVTGVIDKMPKEKLAFTVASVSGAEVTEVPHMNAATAIQGKVAGAKVVSASGEPGTGTSVLLRGATSINADGRSQDPLYIVDGVILESNMLDVDGLDIANIEVVKGAAAASIYGSRAANGVVNITTNRGDRLALNDWQIKVRGEYGWNELPNKISLTEHHHYLVNQNGDWINDAGEVVDRTERAIDGDSPSNAFADNAYKGKLYDHVDQLFSNNNYFTSSISVAKNMQNTNFLFSLSDHRNEGVVIEQDGYHRTNFRLNLDHNFTRKFKMGFSGMYATSTRDDFGGANPFFDVTQFEPDIDLKAKDEDGDYKFQPDPTAIEDNPLYTVTNAEINRDRWRILGSLNANYSLAKWMDIDANFSLDRSDRNYEQYFKKGYKDVDNWYVLGRYYLDNAIDQAINANLTASFYKRFGDFNTRAKLRWLVERTDYKYHWSRGDDLGVQEVRDMDNVAGSKFVDSETQIVKSEGYYFIAGIDYRDRYIADVLVRRDGSSLFGEDERWNTYYRLSGAYRLSQEAWWFTDQINEFKLRASYGTAGRRPNYYAQYETYNLDGGAISKATLGNKELKPEFAKEIEVGADIAFIDRFSLELTYAQSTIEDQILNVPLAGYFGYESRWLNAGTLETTTYEASLYARVINTRDMDLSFGLLFDKGSSKITKFDLPPYRWGYGQEDRQFYNREGEEFGAFYGEKFVKGVDQLPEEFRQYGNQFQVNDDGYFVWVGAGNSWQDGVSKDLWNTSGDLDGDGNDDYDWGMPFIQTDPDGNTLYKIGNVTPDFNLGFSTNFRWQGLSLYVLFDAQIGGDIYNLTKQWSYRDFVHGDVDQAGKSAANKKPIGYYSAVYRVNNVNEAFVEEGTYLKLRELSLRYSFSNKQLRTWLGDGAANILTRVSISLIGRNLFTITDYTGYDPEVGATGGQAGSAAVARFDGHSYPNFRVFTGAIEFEF